MDIKGMMGKLKDGLSSRKKLEPLGQAVFILTKALDEARKKGMMGSPIFQSVHVVLDHCKVTREALMAAVDIVNFMEATPEPSEENGKVLIQKTQAFKNLAVKARLHQYVPLENLQKLDKAIPPLS